MSHRRPAQLRLAGLRLVAAMPVILLSAVLLSVVPDRGSAAGTVMTEGTGSAEMPGSPTPAATAPDAAAGEGAPAQSGGMQDVSPSDDPDAAPSDDPVWAYFLGKASFIFYHDFAAALLQRFDLSYSGKEDAAVDQLTAVLLVAEGGKRYGGVPALDAVQGWLDSWHQAARDDALAAGNGGGSADQAGAAPDDADLPETWAAQHLNADRLMRVACLIYGSDTRAHSLLRDNGTLPANEARDCPAEYAKAKERWAGALRDARIVWRAAAADAQGVPLTLEYKPAGKPSSADIVNWLHDVGLFDALVGDLNQDIVLPAPIKIVLDQCGTATTSFDPDSGTLRLCYELLQGVYDAASAQNVEAPPE